MVGLIVEAIAVGLGIVVVGTLVSWVVGRMMGTDLPPVCKDWNKNYQYFCYLLLFFLKNQ